MLHPVEESVDDAALDIVKDEDYRYVTAEAAVNINNNMRHDIQSVIVNGNWLMKVRSMHPKNFIRWLSEQRLRFRVTSGKEGFKISERTAYNWIHAAERFGYGTQFANFANINLTKLYELSAPEYPLDRVQKAIDDYIFGADDLPAAMQEAVDNGTMGEKQARAVVEAASTVDPAIQKVLEVRVISDPDILPLLQSVGEKSPELLQEIVRTGAIPSGDDTITLDKANARDVKAAYVEKRFNDALGNWQDSRTVILQHARVEPDHGKITVALPKQDKELPPNGSFFITVTYQVDKPLPPVEPDEKHAADIVKWKLRLSEIGGK